MCFICVRMVVTTQLELCLHEQTQIAANTARMVGSQQDRLLAIVSLQFLL